MQRPAHSVRITNTGDLPPVDLLFTSDVQQNTSVCKSVGVFHQATLEDRLALVISARAFLVHQCIEGWSLFCYEPLLETIFGENALYTKFENETERRLVVGLRAAGLKLAGDDAKAETQYRRVLCVDTFDRALQNTDTIFEKVATVCAVMTGSSQRHTVSMFYRWVRALPKRKHVHLMREEMKESEEIARLMTSVLQGEDGGRKISPRAEELPARVYQLTHSYYKKHVCEEPSAWDRY